ncbi:TPA: hypothetical protein DCZ15_01285 [Candidatus Falkowbacteria bacterium]|nr:MAG: Capsular polysaccharide biosynthesis protein [Candidatus Falkowbacteria bacterium GW2011_GWF2_43_32]HBA36488.1 hypothetical protein [Candidatus Falkowbacteria bacterium]
MRKVLIVGAGQAGLLLLNNIKEQKDLQWKVVGFVDDQVKKGSGNKLFILGPINDLPKIVRKNQIDSVIIAVPSERGSFIRKILLLLGEDNKIELLLLPRASEVVFNNEASYKNLRSVEIEDIVGEAIIKSDQLKLDGYFKEKTLLVTGGGGSIGTELSKQIYLLRPKKLVILDCVEKNLFNVKRLLNEISGLNKSTKVIFILGNINNFSLLKRLFKDHNIDIVFHAAAYKHVPIIEAQIYEGIFNNVFGTYHVANLAGKFRCQKFVLISTDKAVSPCNVMGKTKRLAEKIVEYFTDIFIKTMYTTVRFGNVFNSSGSAVEIFLSQIDKNKIVTVTDPKMTRYFMTIPEAVHLVLQASFMAKSDGGKYILKMGDPVNILELAKCLARVRGYKISEVNFKVIGRRPGEKEHEILFNSDIERKQTTIHNRIYSIHVKRKEKFVKFSQKISELFSLLKRSEVMDHSRKGADLLLKRLNGLIRD